MSNLKPWYNVVTPRKDLREDRPLDASEFAVHLDQVRDGSAFEDYKNPTIFFEKTYLTKSILSLSAEVLRRLSGEKTETSAVFNMSTHFGGGKTHALTLLFHLVSKGSDAANLMGVPRIIEKAGINKIPFAKTAVFVGTEFDSIKGRGGEDGTPLRKTPWAEIAYQLSGVDGFNVVREHEKNMQAPAGEVIQNFIPKDEPCLILIDELMNYISRNRRSGLSSQLYTFIHNLSEKARGNEKMALVISIPASELEMSAEDHSDFKRFKKLLDRLGKPIMMSVGAETSEIIRRRLFEWDPKAVTKEGKILLPDDAADVCREYANWVVAHRHQVPGWFADHAKEAFENTYPFHPMVLSVFERKWQELPRFQQTRGILRLLALWVSRSYNQGFKGALKEPLISQGSAPLKDEIFRAAIFEQLGESKLEGAVTTDICGKNDSHATRLDVEAVDTIKESQLHKKIATVIFLESNGGQAKQEASIPEIRMAVGDPSLDMGNIETALDALTDTCYYLTTERNRYCFSLKENLNKRYADRRASVKEPDIDSLLDDEIKKVFPAVQGIERVFFPEKSSQILDRPVITLIILSPNLSIRDDSNIEQKTDGMTREYGKSARTYKSALVWVVPESQDPLRDEARKYIAWNDIASEGLNLDDTQKRQLNENIQRAKRDLKESIWRCYKNIMLLGKDNAIKKIDLGLPTSSSSESMCSLILQTLKQTNEIDKGISPRFLVRNWPPAFTEWSTRAVRDAFFASPQFPRLLYPEAIKETISRGVQEGILAYVGKSPKGGYSPFEFKKPFSSMDVEISEDMFIITAEEAEKHIKPPELKRIEILSSHVQLKPGENQTFTAKGYDQFGRNMDVDNSVWHATGGIISQEGVYKAGGETGNFAITAKVGTVSGIAEVSIKKEERKPEPPELHETLTWSGDVSHQKWVNFYTKVLTKFVKSGELKLNINIEAKPQGGVTTQQVEETKSALRELGLDDDVKTE
jgi:hypothetical protein